MAYCFSLIFTVQLRISRATTRTKKESHAQLSAGSLNQEIVTMIEPNPPTWPESVLIFHQDDDIETMKAKIKKTEDPWDEMNSTFTCENHFSQNRWALLFTPGVYRDLEFEVGYYSQVAGLGTSPDRVQFHGRGPYVPALNRHLHKNGTGTCLDTFWRSGENFANFGDQGMTWAVSQASPLRRVHVTKDLYLHDKDAYASGGHLADAVIDGHTHFGGQQQYFSRNVHFGNGTSGGAWGMVYAACTGETPDPSPGGESSASITIVEDVRVQVEKPYIAMCEDGVEFQLRVPRPSFLGQEKIEPEDVRNFSNVRVAKSSETAATIQDALDCGKDVVLTPGIYYLDRTLEIKYDNQVLLGIGLATLVSPIGKPSVRVAPNVSGSRIAGIMLEAPSIHPSKKNAIRHWSLLEYGAEGIDDSGNANNPGAMFDVFVRVGGAITYKRNGISIDTMVRIFSGNLIGDNLWLWRADHGDLADDEPANCPEVSPVFWQTEEGEFNVRSGIEVFGDDVTLYGLAVEHASGHQTVWRGERGAVYFYQCEFPYDVGIDFGRNGYRAYLIADNVRTHELHSPGIYSNFRNAVVKVETAIQHPTNSSITVTNPFTVHLDNYGVIESVINGHGPPAIQQGIPSRVSETT